MSGHRTRRIVLGIVVIAVLGVVVPPFIHVRTYHARIAGAIGNAIGRKVTVGDVTLRIFPQPGFDLSDVSIGDDPAFSAEPMILAGEMTAYLRLSSLWHGRLEIARLSLTEPSLNLVRNASGQWNVEELLARASQTPSAPTGRTRPEARPRFPYIEADSGRINFKLGDVKTAFALRDADFALWLASEDEWGFRLAAQPVRTDAFLSDTGTLRLTGSFHRARDLAATPFQVHAEWHNAQLGQMTKLVSGRDRGWRGGVDVTADLTGDLKQLNVSARTAVSEFRRYDIAVGDALRLNALCNASYRATGEKLSAIECHLPVGSGDVAVRGGINGIFSNRAYDLSLAATDIPGRDLFAVLRHVKKDLPPDLSGTADLDAAFTLRTIATPAGPQSVWAGGGSIDKLVVRSAALESDLPVGRVVFALLSPPTATTKPVKRPPVPQEVRLQFAPVAIPLGGKQPVTIGGWMSRTRYDFDVHGDSSLIRLFAVARAGGLRPPRAILPGTASFDADVSGAWAGFASPMVTGSAQLRNTAVQFKGIGSPVVLPSATLLLTSAQTSLQNLTATVDGMTFTGAVQIARGCDPISACPMTFNLHAPQISTDRLNRLLNPAFRPRSWFGLGGSPGTSVLAHVRASGSVTTDRVVLKTVSANHVSAQVQLADGQLDISDLRASLFGGQHVGHWHADFTGNEPSYRGEGVLRRASVQQLSAVLNGNWGSGTLTGDYHAAMSGWSSATLTTSLTGALDFDWRLGTLRHLSFAGDGPLRFNQFAGHLSLQDALLSITQSKLQAEDGIYAVSGTASFSRELDLKVARDGGPGFVVTGTLDRPRISPAPPPPQTQAALKYK